MKKEPIKQLSFETHLTLHIVAIFINNLQMQPARKVGYPAKNQKPKKKEEKHILSKRWTTQM